MGLPQYGGEGKGSYKGTKNNSKLPQHGGEKKVGVQDGKLLKPDAGPDRHLKTQR